MTDAAASLGLDDLVASLERMIAEEDRHERWFGDQIRDHWLLPITAALLGWRPPIREPDATARQSTDPYACR